MKRKRILIGGIAVILIIAGGGFALNATGVVRFGGSVRAAKASELPEANADQIGVFTERHDKSIVVATTIDEYSKQDFPDGSKKLTHLFSGPYLEIVTTRNTIIYEDVTNSHPAPHTQQYVEESSWIVSGPRR